jgi:hypothetical protein
VSAEKFTAEERARMHEIFEQALEEERKLTPTRDETRVQTVAIENEFPRLTHDEVAELALEEYASNWYEVPGLAPMTTPRETNWIIWFTDAAGYRRLQRR